MGLKAKRRFMCSSERHQADKQFTVCMFQYIIGSFDTAKKRFYPVYFHNLCQIE